MRGLRRTKQRHPGAARFGGHRQAPQLLVARIGKPGDERVAARGTQNLLRRPESIAPHSSARIAAPGSVHHDEPGEIDPRARQGRRVRQVRRR